MSTKQNQGYILAYTIVIIGVILVVVGLISSTVNNELIASRLESESVKAFYAADTGIECIRYHEAVVQKYTGSGSQVIDCGLGAGSRFTIEGADCHNATVLGASTTVYPPTTITGFTNGACAEISVKIIRTPTGSYILDENDVSVPEFDCKVEIISKGRNSCDAGVGVKKIERTRWENM